MNIWRRRGLRFSLGFGLLCLIILCGCQNPFAESSVSYGALLSYHADFAEVGRQAGRILAGVPPRGVSPEIPQVKRLTLNLRMAHALGLPLSRDLLSRAQDLD